MTGMNVETAAWRRDGIEGEVLTEEVLAARRRRRNLIIGALALLVAVAAILILFVYRLLRRGR